MTDQITSIQMTITFADGKKVQGLIDRDGSQRWGDITPVLGRAVAPMEAMEEAVSPFLEEYTPSRFERA